MAANDGKTLASEAANGVNVSVWGGNEAAWEAAHNAALGGGSSSPTVSTNGLSASDQALLNQMSQGLAGGGNIPWATMLGSFPGDKTLPPAGSSTLGGDTLFGGNVGPLPSNDPNFSTPNSQFQGLTLPASEALGFINGVPTLAGQKQQADIQGTYNPITDYQWISTTHGIVPTGTYAGQGGNEAPQHGPGGDKNMSGGYWAPIYSQTANATLANQENYAQQFGRAGQYGGTTPGATPGGAATLAAQQAFGFAGGSAGGGSPTMDMQKFLTGLVTNAAQGFADPFTQLAKDQTLGNSGYIGNILKNYIQQATGRSISSMAAGPGLTNVQLGTDLANNAVGGSMSPATSTYLNSLFGYNGAGSSASGGSSVNSGAGQIDPTTGALINALQSSSPSGQPTNPLLGANPGWMTSLQGYNKLTPDAQKAYSDLQQFGPNGQTLSTFGNQLAAGGPQFAKAGVGNAAGAVAGL